MADDHVAAITAALACDHHHALGGDPHGDPGIRRNIDALVQPAILLPGQLSQPEGRDHGVTGHRLDKGDQEGVFHHAL